MCNALYVSNDAVNRTVAEELARKAGVQLTPVEAFGHIKLPARDMPVIVEWDSIQPLCRAAVLQQLLAPSPHTHHIHSYNLDDIDTRELQNHGVLVHRRLDQNLFATLAPVRAA
jgi:hypothetical protein